MYVYPNHYKKNSIIIYKKNHPTNIKKKFCLVNIRMINLSFDELRLTTQIRNISDYENRSKGDLIKALSEPKLETPKPKPETPTKTKITNTKARNRNKIKTRTRTKNKGKKLIKRGQKNLKKILMN